MQDEERMRALEQRVVLIERDYAVSGERFTNLNTRLSAIETSLNKLLWVVIGAVAVAVVTFIVKGGLHV